ncbi:MAG: hypothetical protein U0586_03475 [Candidatus Brocadiaceae bacterium]
MNPTAHDSRLKSLALMRLQRVFIDVPFARCTALNIAVKNSEFRIPGI